MSADIAISGLRKAFPGKTVAATPVFDGFDLQIAPGKLVALVGPSGCGKTTLLNLIAGLDTPGGGTVRVGDAGSDPKLSVVFQQPRLLDWLTVRQNVGIVLEREGGSSAAAALVQSLIEKVGLGEHADRYPQFLSGGQKQRAAIARAFALRPDALLLDEPFSALDELTARRLRRLLERLWSDGENSPTGVLVTHNMLEAAFLADTIHVLGGKPARVTATIDVDLPRPRDPDDPRLFDIHRRVMSALG